MKFMSMWEASSTVSSEQPVTAQLPHKAITAVRNVPCPILALTSALRLGYRSVLSRGITSRWCFAGYRIGPAHLFQRLRYIIHPPLSMTLVVILWRDTRNCVSLVPGRNKAEFAGDLPAEHPLLEIPLDGIRRTWRSSPSKPSDKGSAP
jgi:hypothetical protein